MSTWSNIAEGRMNDFDDLGNFDPGKMLGDLNRQFDQMDAFQEKMADLAGRAQDDAGLVTIEFTANGLETLNIAPRAMRLGAERLAETIKSVFAEASADYQRSMFDMMGDHFGQDNNPMKVIEDPAKTLDQIKRAQHEYDRTFDDAMTELERIRKQME